MPAAKTWVAAVNSTKNRNVGDPHFDQIFFVSGNIKSLSKVDSGQTEK